MDDCLLLYNWVNDKEVRKSAFNTDNISLVNHIEWLKTKLHSDNTYMYILYGDQQPIGQIRLDTDFDKTIISYSIDLKYRGLGYGTLLLKETINKIKRDNLPVRSLIGKVKKDNIGSRRTFMKAGFIEIEKEYYFEYSYMMEHF